MRKRLHIFIFALIFLSLNLWSQEIELVNIENPAVAAYMSDSTYFKPLGTGKFTSIVPNYYTKKKDGNRMDFPGGKKLEWQRTVSENEISEIRITLSENQDMRDSVIFNTSKTSDTNYIIRNLYPNRTYYYKLDEYHKDGSVARITSGCFRTKGQLRMIRVSGATNVRDMGGWPTSFGSRIRYGRLYRSGNLDGIRKEGRHDFVDNMNVTAELDLRGESKRTFSALGQECDFIKIVAGSYAGSLSSHGDLFVQDLKWIIDRIRQGKNVDWHCAIGCDRCGTVSFLVGGILGMSEIDLGRDYELSYFAGHDRTCSQGGFRGLLSFIKKQKINPTDDLAQCFYNYLVKNGMSDSDIQFFRNTMLGKDTPKTGDMILGHYKTDAMGQEVAPYSSVIKNEAK